MNESSSQKKSASVGFLIILAIILIGVAGQCHKTPEPDTTPSPVPVISIK